MAPRGASSLYQVGPGRETRETSEGWLIVTVDNCGNPTITVLLFFVSCCVFISLSFFVYVSVSFLTSPFCIRYMLLLCVSFLTYLLQDIT